MIRMIELKYAENFRLRAGDFTCHDTLAPYAVLDLFQDIAGAHATGLKMGFNDLLNRNLIWVILRTKYVVYESPKLYATVTVETWPKKRGRADFDREYTIKGDDGKLLIEGISKWVIVNYETRKISLLKDFDYEGLFWEETNFPNKFERLPDFQEEGEPYISKVRFTDLDHNGHVNNARYTYYVIDSYPLKKEEVIKEFEIDHYNEARLNETIKVYTKIEGKTISYKGILEDGSLCFISQIILKEE